VPREGSAVADGVELRVMTFNIWYGGVQVSREKVVEAIRESGADVVGLQEVDGELLALAREAGWPYANERLHIISRRPLYEPPEADGRYAFVELEPGRIAAVANVHLPATPYGPEAVRDGATPEEVLALERETRLPEIEPYAAALSGLAAKGIPVVLTGDFNTPSHRDRTAATAAARPQVRYPLAWPVTVALEQAGLVDTYRAAHPDPVATPGLTWTPGYPHPRLKPEETLDRIDMVWAGGRASTVDSRIVGEAGGPDVDVEVDPYPSDHRGVVSTVELTPAVAPNLVEVDHRVTRLGDPFTVRFLTPGRDDGRLVVVPAGKGGSDPVAEVAVGDTTDRPSFTFGSSLLRAGAYRAVMLDGKGRELAAAPLWLLAPDAEPELEVASRTVAPGAPIEVRFRGAPGNRFDWVGVWEAGDPDLYSYLSFVYTGARVDGSLTLDEETLGARLEPGWYEVRLMRDDAYVALDAARFTVTKGG